MDQYLFWPFLSLADNEQGRGQDVVKVQTQESTYMVLRNFKFKELVL